MFLVNRICDTRDEQGDVMRVAPPGTGGAHLVGIVDLAYPRDEGRWEIVEYKTGRRRREVLGLHADQAKVYAAGLRSSFPGNVRSPIVGGTRASDVATERVELIADSHDAV